MVFDNGQSLFDIPNGLRPVCLCIPGQAYRADSAQPTRKLFHRKRAMLQACTKNGLSNSMWIRSLKCETCFYLKAVIQY